MNATQDTDSPTPPAANSSRGTAGARPPAALAGDREQARSAGATVTALYGGLAAAARSGIAATKGRVTDTLARADTNAALLDACAALSEQARRETIDYARRSAGLADIHWTCQKATALMLRRTHEAHGLTQTTRAKVVGVNAKGDHATATVRFGGGKGRVSTIPLVKENGEWKLAATLGG